MSKIEDIRNSFIKMRCGKLISVEAFVIGFIIFFIISIKDKSQYLALLISVIVGFGFPVLVGSFKTVAWLAAIVFSLLWSVIGFVIGGALFGSSFLAGLLIGIVIFVISFWAHKNYSGITFQNISRKKGNLDYTEETNFTFKESIRFCPKCGRRITSSDGTCDVCDK